MNGDIQKSTDEHSSGSSLEESENEEERQIRAALSQMPLPQVMYSSPTVT